MMEILEIFVKDKGYTYMKMDGSTSIGSRQPAITKFNSVSFNILMNYIFNCMLVSTFDSDFNTLFLIHCIFC